MKKLLAPILILLGIVGGGAAGMFLKPPPPEPEEDEKAAGKKNADAMEEELAEVDELQPRSYVKIGRQTIVPIVDGGATQALMLFELAIDVAPTDTDRVLNMEPRLRDAFLKELFKMSHTGAFLSTFTDDRVIDELRSNLVRAAREHLGKDAVKDVLILDVMRQEM